MYNGATDRYDWKLVGKREVYIPYNSYQLIGNTLKYSDVLKPRHLNPDLRPLRAAPRMGGGGDAQAGHAATSTRAHVLHRRG